MTKRKVYKILLSRLEEFGIHPTSIDDEPWWINYDNKISVYGLLSRTKKENPIVHCKENDRWAPEDWSAADHARRIKYLTNHKEELEDPINLQSFKRRADDYCVVIEDGWHRLYGHFYLGKKYIKATWKGSRNLLNYLMK